MFYIGFSLILTNLIFIVIFSYYADSLKLIDYPDIRKSHIGKVPLVGGISLFISLLIHLYFIKLPFFINVIILSSSIIVLTGFIDDIIQLNFKIRLFSQVIASLVVLGSGLSIINLGNYTLYGNIEIGIFGALFSIFAIVATINAFNFMDGIDGLAAGLTLIGLLSILFYSYIDLGLDNELIIIYLILLLISFLFINLKLTPFRKIFLGDAGSMLTGFLLGWLLIFYTHPDYRNFHPVLTLWCVSIPAFDSLSVLINRLKDNRSPFLPDKGHLHHLMLLNGYGHNISLMIIVSFGVSLSLFGGIVYLLFGSLICLLSYIFCFFVYFFVKNKILKLKK